MLRCDWSLIGGSCHMTLIYMHPTCKYNCTYDLCAQIQVMSFEIKQDMLEALQKR